MDYRFIYSAYGLDSYHNHGAESTTKPFEIRKLGVRYSKPERSKSMEKIETLCTIQSKGNYVGEVVRNNQLFPDTL